MLVIPFEVGVLHMLIMIFLGIKLTSWRKGQRPLAYIRRMRYMDSTVELMGLLVISLKRTHVDLLPTRRDIRFLFPQKNVNLN